MKSDFQYLARVTPAQWNEVRAVINASANLASWDVPMQRATGAAGSASSKAANLSLNASKTWDRKGWARAFQKVRGTSTRKNDGENDD
jgi:hypothetical protein